MLPRFVRWNVTHLRTQRFRGLLLSGKEMLRFFVQRLSVRPAITHARESALSSEPLRILGVRSCGEA